MTSNRFRIAAAIAAIIVLGAGGTWYALSAHSPSKKGQAVAVKKVFRCPMHPETSYDREGNCTVCGMRLVPADADSAPADPSCGGDPAGGCCSDAPADPSTPSK